MIPRYEVMKAIADISGQSLHNIVNMKQFADDSEEWPTEEEASESDTPLEPEVVPGLKPIEENASAEQSADEEEEEKGEVPELETSRSNSDMEFEKDDDFEWHTDDSADDPLGIIKGSKTYAGERKKDDNLSSSQKADAEVDLNPVSEVCSFCLHFEGVGVLTRKRSFVA